MSEHVRKIVLRVVFPLIIVISVFTLPLLGLSADISPLLTVVSLVFAVLVGFFIATATTNYINFQHYLAQENANLIALFNLGNMVSPSEKEKTAETIDQYVIATLDFSLAEYIEKTHQEFKRVVEHIDTLKPKKGDGRSTVAFDHLQATKIELFRNRESVALAALRITNGLHWLILTFLASTLVFLLFTMRTDALLVNGIIAVLSSAVYYILLLLHEIDGNVFLEEQLAYQDVQKVFRAIGRLPYYPSFAFASAKLKTPGERYRLGIYADYPRSCAKKIKVCDGKEDTSTYVNE
ncbi:MAG: hypothetical protein A2946_00685 [Candidatus Liptonbacteria bacterium RIFCSPLOWO2_01_FULL_53_13]|uniref:DUF4239 domain-containing protein n=1 Tax=Candidatus Liptonbacteria bacterium RIFCSPLOWO2_01_FULL_53_13 TaxID=1798651 RepID=A0A1G2CPX9_9BACT|nr:MAG: hypothetical protein A2946_00685 [Candidatus Liptonbacteria bacterium RIFCSPLOWO2_01_FULL_53_13]